MRSVAILLLSLFIWLPTFSQASDPKCTSGERSPFSPPIALLEKYDILKKQTRNIEQYCPNLSGLKARAKRNLDIVEKELAKLRSIRNDLAARGEIRFALPQSCRKPQACTQSGGLCQGLDPCKYEDFETYLERIRCMSRSAARAASSGYGAFATGSDYLPRWHRGRSHRETMRAYHDIFSAMESLFNFFDELLDKLSDLPGTVQDELKNELKEALKEVVVEDLRNTASQEEMNRLRQLQRSMESVQEVKASLDLIRDIVKRSTRGGAPSPAWLFKLNSVLYSAAAQATGVAVKGWKAYGNFLTTQFVTAYQHYLCARKYYKEYLQALDQCGDFCTKAKECHKRQIEQMREKLSRLRQQQETEITRQVDRIINSHSRELCRELCGKGRIKVPSPNQQLAKKLNNLLKQHLGKQYCWLRFEFWANCEGTNCDIRYNVEFAEGRPFHSACCDRKPDESTPTSRPGKDCKEPAVIINDKPIRDGQEIRMHTGTVANIRFTASSPGRIGSDQAMLMWISRPEARRPTRYNRGPVRLSLTRPGVYEIEIRYRCGEQSKRLRFRINAQSRNR